MPYIYIYINFDQDCESHGIFRFLCKRFEFRQKEKKKESDLHMLEGIH